MKWTFVTLFFILVAFNLKRSIPNCNSVRCVSFEDSTVSWGNKIRIKDFCAKQIPSSAPSHALFYLTVGQSFEYDTLDNHVEISLKTVLYKSQSWIKDKKDDKLVLQCLNYGDLLFNAQEVITRRIRKSLQDLPPSGFEDQWYEIQDKMIDIRSMGNVELSKQLKLDTDSGKNSLEMETWRKRIDSLLIDLNAFSSPRVLVPYE